jgi:hypothetical protein
MRTEGSGLVIHDESLAATGLGTVTVAHTSGETEADEGQEVWGAGLMGALLLAAGIVLLAGTRRHRGVPPGDGVGASPRAQEVRAVSAARDIERLARRLLVLTGPEGRRERRPPPPGRAQDRPPGLRQGDRPPRGPPLRLTAQPTAQRPSATRLGGAAARRQARTSGPEGRRISPRTLAGCAGSGPGNGGPRTPSAANAARCPRRGRRWRWLIDVRGRLRSRRSIGGVSALS